MRFRTLCVLPLIAAVQLTAAEATVPSPVLAKYQDCVLTSTKEDAQLADLIAVCREPAEAGIPGAQYALGVALFARNQAGDRTAAMELLEKSVASGSPVAAFAYAGVLLQENSPASSQRAGELLRLALCADYPAAVSAFAQQGIRRETIGCSPAADEDFTGEWVTDLKWVKIEPIGGDDPQLKLVFENDTVKVFMKSGDAWTEVKPGTFKVAHVAQSISVSSIESGWDFDGKWIEAWTVQLLRTGPDEASATFLRTVNNPHLPATLSWRTFSTLAEGTARRVRAE